MKTRHRLIYPAALFVLLLVHLALFFHQFPPRLFLENRVPLNVDTTRYFASLCSADGAGGLYGYDPYQMAGYNAGLWNSMGKKGFELARFFFPGLSLERRFYLTLLSVVLGAPLLLWGAARGVFATRWEQFGMALLSLLIWHFETQVAYFWHCGNVFFPGGSVLLGCCLLLIWRLLFANGGWVAAFLLAGCGAAMFYVHTVTVVPAALGTLALAGAAVWQKRLRGAALLQLGGAALLGLALVLPWLLPLVATRSECVPMPGSWFQGGLKHTIMDVFSDRAYQHHFDRLFLFQMCMLTGAVGSLLALQRSERRMVLPFSLGTLVCLVVAYGARVNGPICAHEKGPIW
jgi:hypothetical protein